MPFPCVLVDTVVMVAMVDMEATAEEDTTTVPVWISLACEVLNDMVDTVDMVDMAVGTADTEDMADTVEMADTVDMVATTDTTKFPLGTLCFI